MEKFGVYSTADGVGTHSQIYIETEIDRSEDDPIVKVIETKTTYTYASDDVTTTTSTIADTTPDEEQDGDQDA